MPARIFRITLLLLIVAAGVGEIAVLHRNHRRLRQRAAALRQQNEQTAQRREESQRTQSLIARAQAGDAEAARLIHSKLLQARAEMARLEQTAEQQHLAKMATAAVAAEALANNRDPEKGLMRLEYFQNVGRSTPSTAFQTLIWAVTKGDDDSVAGGLSLTKAAREQAQAIIATLPEAMRATYPTPEKLAALAVADIVLDQTAIQVLGQAPTDPLTTSLSINGLEAGPEKVSFRLGANGWQMVISSGAIRALHTTLIAPPVAAGTK